MSKETGLICTGEMIRAILDGRKTQTRRICKFEATDSWEIDCLVRNGVYFRLKNRADIPSQRVNCPYGGVGEKLWLREGYRIRQSCCNVDLARENVLGFYLADDIHFSRTLTNKESELFNKRKKPFARTPGRFMYKSLARLWREITAIRIEILREISDEDIICEGFECREDFYGAIIKMNKAKNPEEFLNKWIWVLEFKKIEEIQ